MCTRQSQLDSMCGQLRPCVSWTLSGACWQANGLEDHATAQELGWSQAPEDLPAAAVVLCSDLVYEREVVPSLCEVLQRLCKPDTLLLMAMEIRPAIHAYALEQLAASGLSAQKVLLPEEQSCTSETCMALDIIAEVLSGMRKLKALKAET